MMILFVVALVAEGCILVREVSRAKHNDKEQQEHQPTGGSAVRI